VSKTEEPLITREWYEAFQRAELDRWDSIIADDVLVNSPAGFGLRGLAPFKEFGVQFTDLGYRIDLIDEHLALDDRGSGRGFVTFLLHWKHTKPFGGFAPTGREGTSLETALLTIVEHQIVRVDVAVNTTDLALYESELGWDVPHNVSPEPLVAGIDRRDREAVSTMP